MQATLFTNVKFKKNFWKLIAYFLAVAVTPVLANAASLLVRGFLYAEELRPLFYEALTMIFWGIEALVFRFVRKKVEKRKGIGEAPIEEGSVERLLVDDGIVEIAVVEGKRKKKKKREPKPPMPIKNFWILTGICAACVLLASAVIGFQVKPFYDLGKKFTGVQMFCRIGTLVKNGVKCIWTVGILAAAKGIAETVFEGDTSAQKKYFVWLTWSGIFLCFGLFDIFTSVISYPIDLTEIGLAAVYFLFYLVFPIVYTLAEESKVKSFFLILLIYLF